jgi:hypothetical protein
MSDGFGNWNHDLPVDSVSVMQMCTENRLTYCLTQLKPFILFPGISFAQETDVTDRIHSTASNHVHLSGGMVRIAYVGKAGITEVRLTGTRNRTE